MSDLEKNNTNIQDILVKLQQKLIDLTGRNSLINLKYPKNKSLRFVGRSIETIYKELVENNPEKGIAIIALPDPPKDRWIEKNSRLELPDEKEWATANNIPVGYDTTDADPNLPNLQTLYYSDTLSSLCRKLEKESQLIISEKGTNMLFLVLGVLEFSESPNSKSKFTAPLLSIPVSLKSSFRKGHEEFSIYYTGEEISDNLSLHEKLRCDFNLSLPTLPEEDLNIIEYFTKVQEVIESRPWFSIKHNISLCILNFSNMLLLKDLNPERWQQNSGENILLEHKIINELFGENDDDTRTFIPESVEDYSVEEKPGIDIPLVYDADSSQHSAIIDVLAYQKNLVIEGPPGTGKSQTITNLISAGLDQGLKILFITEKMAALEVVKRRLVQAGLETFVLELHSDKTNKKELLTEIEASINFKPTRSQNINILLQELDLKRKELVSYSEVINSKQYNQLNLTIHQIIWRFEKYRLTLGDNDHITSILDKIVIDNAESVNHTDLNRYIDYLDTLTKQYQLSEYNSEDFAFFGFNPDNFLVSSDIDTIKDILHQADEWSKVFIQSIQPLLALFGTVICNFTKEVCYNQITQLESFLQDIKGKENLPLDLVPILFNHNDPISQIELSINSFIRKIQEFNALGKFTQILKQENNICEKHFKGLSLLQPSIEKLGLVISSFKDLKQLNLNKLRTALTKLEKSEQELSQLLKDKNITYDGSFVIFEQLTKFYELISSNIPEQFISLQTEALLNINAVEELQKLSQLQNDWVELENSLNEIFYLDPMPQQQDIDDAILSLRSCNNNWYRIFQNQWYKAKKIYRSLQQNKSVTSQEQQIQNLQKLSKLIRLKNQWRNSTVWQGVLRLPTPTEAIYLDNYIQLACWNRDISRIAKNLNINLNLSSLNIVQLHQYRSTFSSIGERINNINISIKTINELLPNFSISYSNSSFENIINSIHRPLQILEYCSQWANRHTDNNITFKQAIEACQASLKRSKLKDDIESDSYIKSILGVYYQGINTNYQSILDILNIIHKIENLDLIPNIKTKLKKLNPNEASQKILKILKCTYSGLEQLENFINQLSVFDHSFNYKKWVGISIEEDLHKFATLFLQSVQKALLHINQLIAWSQYITYSKEPDGIYLSQFINLLEENKIPPNFIANAYEYCLYRTIIHTALDNLPEFRLFSRIKHEDLQKKFRELDKKIIELRGQSIAYTCKEQVQLLPGKKSRYINERTEMALLDYLIPQKRPRMPIRSILAKAKNSIQALKPCFMMSPQAVSQYLIPGEITFDLVIMDEASQLPLEKAIGSIIRGNQLVVVGDSNQLPPTSFFSQTNQYDNNEDEELITQDAESILSTCSTQFKPTRYLRWHYRSQHQSLIAFSNYNFYENKLIIFPSPYTQGDALGVRAIYLANAVYENNMNKLEAEYIINAVIEHIRTKPNISLGIVTLNQKQRDLIEEQLDKRLQNEFDPKINEYRQYWQKERQDIFVKNLENVQGDERDCIMISTTFGKPVGSKVIRQNFGPISRQDGWRRLNVLFTRARKSIIVYTSMQPEDIIVNENTQKGTKILRDYLEYIRSGSLNYNEETGREPDSDFEIAVINILKSKGYEVTPQLGVAGYRIDIAVKHPDIPGTYLAAIECDGATYHSAHSARDRDRIRQEILESMGWRNRIWRIWSTDWFRYPKDEINKLIDFLNNLRQSWRPKPISTNVWQEEQELPSSFNIDTLANDNDEN